MAASRRITGASYLRRVGPSAGRTAGTVDRADPRGIPGGPTATGTADPRPDRRRRPRRRVLLVCSTGGHLAQLHRLRAVVAQRHDRAWVTFDKADARSLLAGERRGLGLPPHHPQPPQPRCATSSSPSGCCADVRPDVIVSNGAGVAVPFFVLARLLGSRTVYIEVFDRIDSPDRSPAACAGRSPTCSASSGPSSSASTPAASCVGPLL